MPQFVAITTAVEEGPRLLPAPLDGRLHALHVLLEVGQCPFMLAHQHQHVGHQLIIGIGAAFVVDPRALAAAGDQIGLSQNPEMSGDAALAHAQDVDHLIDVERRPGQQAQQTQARLVGQGFVELQQVGHDGRNLPETRRKVKYQDFLILTVDMASPCAVACVPESCPHAGRQPRVPRGRPRGAYRGVPAGSIMGVAGIRAKLLLAGIRWEKGCWLDGRRGSLWLSPLRVPSLGVGRTASTSPRPSKRIAPHPTPPPSRAGRWERYAPPRSPAR